jgi:hypothetical protein
MSVVQRWGSGSYLRGLYCCRFSSMGKAESTSDARRLVDWARELLLTEKRLLPDCTGFRRIRR